MPLAGGRCRSLGKRVSLIDRRDIPFAGAVAVIAILAAVLFATLAAASTQPEIAGYRLDDYKMAIDCVAGQPVYQTPDGRLWAWQDGWAQANSDIREPCGGVM